MTGRYGFRTGIGKPVPDGPERAAPRSSHPSEFTLPEAFKRAFEAQPEAAYHLALIGKWHLSRGIDDPWLQGWDHFSGPHPRLAALDDYYSLAEGGERRGIAIVTDYATTDQVDDALDEIAKARDAGRNYLIWLALSAPHAPYQRPPLALLDAYKGVPATGASRRTYYEAMIEAMDTELGRLLAGVDLATTTVIFLGDNGTPNEVTATPYNADHAKLRVYEQGVKVPMIVAGVRGSRTPGRQVDRSGQHGRPLPDHPAARRHRPGGRAAERPEDRRRQPAPIASRTPAPRRVRPWAYADKFDLLYNQKWERAINDTRYKLIERAAGLQWPVREFFDLQADPYETKNLLKRSLTSVPEEPAQLPERRARQAAGQPVTQHA